MSKPVLVCALRGIDAFRALGAALKGWTQGRDRLSTGDSLPQAVMALTPEVTFRQAILFFTEADLVTGKARVYCLHYPRGVWELIELAQRNPVLGLFSGTEKLHNLGVNSVLG